MIQTLMQPHIVRILFIVSALLSVAACAEPVVNHRATETSGVAFGPSDDPRILAGEWEYEAGAVVMLTLDEQGNGTYAWKDGQFKTVMLSGRRWNGMWSQRENDREGGFTVEFSPDFSEGEGWWWYTRIGEDQAPSQKGGTFHLSRKGESTALNETPPPP